MTVSLVDTTVLNNLAQIERPELLHLLTLEAATTTYVLAELQVGVDTRFADRHMWDDIWAILEHQFGTKVITWH